MTQSENGAGTRELLRLDDVKKHYPVTTGLIIQRTIGLVKAVDGISMTLGEGETYSLVGESGCGKTTTSRMVLMVERPTEGETYFQGNRWPISPGRKPGSSGPLQRRFSRIRGAP